MRTENDPAARYVRGIRNPAKQAYARALLAASTSGQRKPERPAGLSVMAAQAVELRLAELTGPEGFYATVQRNAAGGKVRTGFLLGPYATKADAEQHVPEAKILAHQADPRTAFDAFGVTRVQMKPGASLPEGVLNHRLPITC